MLSSFHRGLAWLSFTWIGFIERKWIHIFFTEPFSALANAREEKCPEAFANCINGPDLKFQCSKRKKKKKFAILNYTSINLKRLQHVTLKLNKLILNRNTRNIFRDTTFVAKIRFYVFRLIYYLSHLSQLSIYYKRCWLAQKCIHQHIQTFLDNLFLNYL